jgi:hypothetical protein
MYFEKIFSMSSSSYPVTKKPEDLTGAFANAIVNSFTVANAESKENSAISGGPVSQLQAQAGNVVKTPPRSGAELFDLIFEAYQEQKETAKPNKPAPIDLGQFNLTYAEYLSFCYERHQRNLEGGQETFDYTTPDEFPLYPGSEATFPAKSSADTYAKKYTGGMRSLTMSEFYLWGLNERAKDSPDYPENFYAAMELYNQTDWEKYSYRDKNGNGQVPEDFGNVLDALRAFTESHKNSNWQNYLDIYDELLGDKNSASKTATAREMLAKLTGKTHPEAQIPLDGLAAMLATAK